MTVLHFVVIILLMEKKKLLLKCHVKSLSVIIYNARVHYDLCITKVGTVEFLTFCLLYVVQLYYIFKENTICIYIQTGKKCVWNSRVTTTTRYYIGIK